MDQHKRCTVGGFNWTPSVIDMESVDEVATVSAQRHTALHETIHVRAAPPRISSRPPSRRSRCTYTHPHHPPRATPRADARVREQVLGGIKYKNLINGTTGERLRDIDTVMKEVEDEGYPGKKMLKLITPQVLRVAREQFGCETLVGIPLEDQPLGKVRSSFLLFAPILFCLLIYSFVCRSGRTRTGKHASWGLKVSYRYACCLRSPRAPFSLPRLPPPPSQTDNTWSPPFEHAPSALQ